MPASKVSVTLTGAVVAVVSVGAGGPGGDLLC